MSKIMAALTAMGMALIGMVVTLTTIIQIALLVIGIVVGILIALMIILFSLLAPVSWLVYAAIAVIGIILGAVVGAGISNSFCISANALVMTEEGPISMKNIRVGDRLANNAGEVSAVMQFLPPPNITLLDIDGIVMSPTHMLDLTGKPIYASNHEMACAAAPELFLYNLNTTSRRIPLLGKSGTIHLAYDYEELSEDDIVGLANWRTFVFKHLNPGCPAVVSNIDMEEAGILPNVEVHVWNRGLLPISGIH